MLVAWKPISVTPAPGTTLVDDDGYNLVGNGAGLDMGVASLSSGSASHSSRQNWSQGANGRKGAGLPRAAPLALLPNPPSVQLSPITRPLAAPAGGQLPK